MSVAWNAFKQGQAIIKSSEKCVSRSRERRRDREDRERERARRSLTQALSSIKLNFALTEARCKLTGSSCKDRWQGPPPHARFA